MIHFVPGANPVKEVYVVLKKSKLVLTLLTMRYLNLDITTVLLQPKFR
jgi:hypothetical protein